MSIAVLIDGGAHTGHYRCQCECGTTWTGQGAEDGHAVWSPAMPLAEAVAHFKMCHAETSLDLRLTERFKTWLTQYWERWTARAENAARPTNEAALRSHSTQSYLGGR